ncbi:hypothetical protein AVEN_240734-1, partial [Araneus ventricosus]
ADSALTQSSDGKIHSFRTYMTQPDHMQPAHVYRK